MTSKIDMTRNQIGDGDLTLSGRRQNPDPGFDQYSAALLQLAVLWHSRWFDEPSAVSSESCRMSLHLSKAVLAHHASPTSAHWLPVRRRVDFKISTLVYHSLTGTTADECTLVTAAGRCPLRCVHNEALYKSMFTFTLPFHFTMRLAYLLPPDSTVSSCFKGWRLVNTGQTNYTHEYCSPNSTTDMVCINKFLLC